MNAIAICSTKDMPRIEWLSHRKKGIGGSDVGAIMGVNPYKTILDVYINKVSEDTEEKDQSEAAYWGTTLEDIVAKEFEKRTGKKVRRRNAILRHPKYEFIFANIDREIVGEKAILECKTANVYFAKQWEDDEVPASYIYQVQHYMAVTGYERAYIAVLIGGNRFLWKVIERDDELIEMMISAEKDFWENYVLRHIPPVHKITPTTDSLKRLYPFDYGNIAAIDDETEENIKLLLQIKESEKELKTQKEMLEIKIKLAMKDTSVICNSQYKVTWKEQAVTRLDTRRLKEELPDIADKYTVNGIQRKFLVKELI